ncbi:pyridoxamine 5'-phosphate oxidase family protein [Litorisediminicola beolgyonensis]|uniref:Pyridoxamine 5'-phosphate oxidase family protein n=1 Tax=Litorisediminicola beolgyonensis TaxID=1173614 RepID=A0ABW3ZEJ2_9RHOB
MGRPFDPHLLLTAPLMAVLSTVSETGAPRNAPVWYAWEEDALWMLSHDGASSLRRIAANAEVSVEILDYDNGAGRLRHLGLRGQAEIHPMDPPFFRRLLARYLGPEPTWNRWFIETVARIDDPDGRLIRLVPSSVFTNDVSHFRTGPAFATGEDG